MVLFIVPFRHTTAKPITSKHPPFTSFLCYKKIPHSAFMCYTLVIASETCLQHRTNERL